MKTKIIKFRSVVNAELLRKHIRRFFIYLSNQTKSQYIDIHSTITYDIVGGYTENLQLSQRFIINMDANDEKRYYNEYIISKYQKSDISKDKSIKLREIQFHYIETNEDEYDNFIRNLIKSAHNNRSDKNHIEMI